MSGLCATSGRCGLTSRADSSSWTLSRPPSSQSRPTYKGTSTPCSNTSRTRTPPRSVAELTRRVDHRLTPAPVLALQRRLLLREALRQRAALCGGLPRALRRAGLRRGHARELGPRGARRVRRALPGARARGQLLPRRERGGADPGRRRAAGQARPQGPRGPPELCPRGAEARPAVRRCLSCVLVLFVCATWF